MDDVKNAAPDSQSAISNTTTFAKAPWVATTGLETAGFFVDYITAALQAAEQWLSLSQIASATSTLASEAERRGHCLAAEIPRGRKK